MPPFILAALPWGEIILWSFLAILASIVLWFLLKRWAAIRSYTLEVAAELKKCSWPWDPKQKGLKKYKELIDSTVVVAVSSILLAGFVTFADFIVVRVVGFLTQLNF